LTAAAKAAVFLAVRFRDGKEGSGSGFVVTPTGHVVTSFHVVDNAESVQARIESRPGQPVDAHVLGYDPDADLAVLSLPEGEYDWLALESRAYRPGLGDPIAVLGYPLGDDLGKSLSFTDGAVGSLRERGDVLLIQISAAATHGSSGGAVVNRETWRAIGVLQGGIPVDVAAGFNFAISVDEIYKRFGSLSTGRKAVTSQPTETR
jgi:serine protease Do